MSLDWVVSKVKDREKVCWKENPDGTFYLNPITNQLIWECLNLGMSGITEKNWKEFAFRIAFDQTLFGPAMHGPSGPFKITAEDVRRHIGLSTNVTQVPRAKFIKQKLERYEEEMFK